MDPIIHQSIGTTKVQLHEQISFTVFTHKSMGEELLTGEEKIQRQLHLQSQQKLGKVKHVEQPSGSSFWQVGVY